MPSLAALQGQVPREVFEAMLAVKNVTEDMAARPSLEAMRKICSTLKTLPNVASGLWTEMKSTDVAYWTWYDKYFVGDHALVRLRDTLESIVSVLEDEVVQPEPTRLSSTRASEGDSNLTHLTANALPRADRKPPFLKALQRWRGVYVRSQQW